MCSLQIRHLILLTASTIASASRIDAYRIDARKKLKEMSALEGNHQLKSLVTNAASNDLVDVTEIVARELFEESNYKCCCDKAKQDDSVNKLKGWLRGQVEYSGVCEIVPLDGILDIQSCGDVKFGHNKGHNYLSTTDEKCEIKTEDVRAIYEKYGSPLSYCRGTRAMDDDSHFVALPRASLNEQVAFMCEDGATPVDDGRVKCEWSTPAAGRFGHFACRTDPPEDPPSQPAIWYDASDEDVNVASQPPRLAPPPLPGSGGPRLAPPPLPGSGGPRLSPPPLPGSGGPRLSPPPPLLSDLERPTTTTTTTFSCDEMCRQGVPRSGVDAFFQERAECSCDWKELKLGRSDVTDDGLQELSKHCKDVHEIWLTRTKVTDAGVKEIAQRCPKLQKIILDVTGDGVGDASVEELVERCPALKELHAARTSATNALKNELRKKYKHINFGEADWSK